MLKKIALFLAILLLAIGAKISKGGVLDNGYAMLGGGAFGTVDQLKTGDIRGFFTGSGLLPLYWNSKILLRASFADLNNDVDVENYSGNVMLLSRTIESAKINPYAFGALSMTHNSESETEAKNSFSLDGGVGMFWELFGARWYGEVSYKDVAGNDSFSLGFGLLFDLSKPTEQK